MMEMPPLPGLPALGAQTERVEVWGLMQDYARAYGESCARMAREEERERCIQACKGEEVDADGSQHREDVAYNTAIEHCIEAIRKG